MTFTFDGDLEISAGDKLAFTGPNAPMGLKLESSEGPYFEVLGEDGAWHKDMKINRLPDTEVLPPPHPAPAAAAAAACLSASAPGALPGAAH